MFGAFVLAMAISNGTPDAGAAQAVADDLNGRRAGARIAPLVIDPQLTAVAVERAADLIRRHYFSHVNPDGMTAIDSLRAREVRFAYAGENLASAETVRAAETGLWASADHRNNILEPHYKRVGIAVFRTPDTGNVIVQIFTD